MTGAELIAIVISSSLGSSGFVGILIWLLKRYIENKIKIAEKVSKEQKERKIKEAEIDDELHHAYGRLFFWLYHWAKTGEDNSEMDKAFYAFEVAEQKKKEYTRQIAASAKIETK